MEKKSQNPIESGCYAMMRFLGSTTRSVRDGFYYVCPFMRQKSPENTSRCLAPEASIVKEPTTVFVPEVAALPVQKPLLPESQSKEVQPFFRGMEFENELERVKAEVFVKDFQSPLAETRAEALNHLKEISKPAAVAILRKLLQSEEDPLQIIEILNCLSSLNDDGKLEKQIFMDFSRNRNSGVRQTAVRSIARYGDDESFSIISSSLKDEDAEVRRQALNCISWFFRDRCAPAALKSLHDDDYHTRETAIFICGTLKLRQSISALITLLSDLNKDVQKKAVVSLRKITKQNFGFKATDTEKNKKAAIEDWRFWWRDNQTKFMA